MSLGFKDEIIVLQDKVAKHNHHESYAFYGSSSIRLWENLESDLAPRNIINLGFGGSSYGWMAHYYEDLFRNQRHDHYVLYAGDNDHSSGHLSERILTNFRRLTHEIWSDSPTAHIHVISIKPSPHREHQLMKIRETNDILRSSITSNDKGHWVNVFDEMLIDEKPIPELFVEDMLHMNEKGYAIWKRVLLKHFEGLKC